MKKNQKKNIEILKNTLNILTDDEIKFLMNMFHVKNKNSLLPKLIENNYDYYEISEIFDSEQYPFKESHDLSIIYNMFDSTITDRHLYLESLFYRLSLINIINLFNDLLIDMKPNNELYNMLTNCVNRKLKLLCSKFGIRLDKNMIIHETFEQCKNYF